MFILGGPGCGKGTQCERIVRDYGFTHVSVGELLRNEINSGSDKGKEILEFVQKGDMVPQSITVGLLEKSIKNSSSMKILIDGFPRELG